MNFMIVAILLIGAATLSSQSPIAINTANQIVLGYPEAESDAADDLDTAENYIFMPYFRYKERKTFRRRPREAAPEDFSAVLPQIPQEDAVNDLEPAENYIFRPYFRYNQRRALRRHAREAAPEDFSAELPQIPQEDVADDLVPAENYIFRPYFRYNQRKALRRRARLAVAESSNNHRRSVRSVESEIPEGGDDLEVAENHIFLPVFRYKQRAAYRQRVKKNRG